MESNQKEKSESTKKTNSPNTLGYIIRGALVGVVLGLVLPLTFGLVMNEGKMDDLAFAILALVLFMGVIIGGSLGGCFGYAWAPTKSWRVIGIAAATGLLAYFIVSPTFLFIPPVFLFSLVGAIAGKSWKKTRLSELIGAVFGGILGGVLVIILAYILSFTTTTFLFGLKNLASMSF